MSEHQRLDSRGTYLQPFLPQLWAVKPGAPESPQIAVSADTWSPSHGQHLQEAQCGLDLRPCSECGLLGQR